MLGLIVVASFGCGGDETPAATDSGIDSGSGGSNTGGSNTGGSMTGGSMNTSDASTDAAADATMDATVIDSGTPLPTDGNQGAVCVGDTDCNQGFGCFDANLAGQGICTTVCSGDGDCSGLTDGDYACGTMGAANGNCVVSCTGTDDTSSCPSPQTCQAATGGGGGGATFYCQNPPPPPAGQWEACATGIASCGNGFACATTFATGYTGFCTETCMQDSDCSDPPSGDATVSCPMVGGGGGMTRRCEYRCMNGETCPDGMECTPDSGGGGAALAGYCRIPN